MKNLFLIFAIASILMLMISCSEEQPTKFSKITYDKYQIQNDTNWVEVIDIDTVDVCVRYEVYYGGKIASNEEQFKEYFMGNFQHMKPEDSLKYHCYFNYIRPDIDFEKSDILLFFMQTGGGFPVHTRRLYKNTQSKQYLYLLTINRTKTTEENSFFDETIKIPKIEEGFVITFDTLRFDN